MDRSQRARGRSSHSSSSSTKRSKSSSSSAVAAEKQLERQVRGVTSSKRKRTRKRGGTGKGRGKGKKKKKKKKRGERPGTVKRRNKKEASGKNQFQKLTESLEAGQRRGNSSGREHMHEQRRLLQITRTHQLYDIAVAARREYIAETTMILFSLSIAERNDFRMLRLENRPPVPEPPQETFMVSDNGSSDDEESSDVEDDQSSGEEDKSSAEEDESEFD